MRKLFVGLLMLGMFSALAIANTTYVFEPVPNNMYNLNHHVCYTWGIDLTSKGFSPGTTITEAKLTFYNIRNWDNNENVLFIHLLNDPAVGLTGTTDQPSIPAISDGFSGQGVLIDEWTTNTTPTNRVYTFSSYTPPGGENLLAALNSYASNGIVGFGIDPDCHYWNDGVELEITVCKAPAPGAILLGSMGICIVGWLRRRKTL